MSPAASTCSVEEFGSHVAPTVQHPHILDPGFTWPVADHILSPCGSAQSWGEMRRRLQATRSITPGREHLVAAGDCRTAASIAADRAALLA
jgi:hypothetical protein